VDIMVVISFSLVVLNFLLTIRRRTEPSCVSIWYAAAAMVLTAALTASAM
jgi:cbb3-type cytochrome oxidase subunit 1